MIAFFPYRLHTVLTDNGIQFTHRKGDRYASMHLFDRVCRQHGIEHRLTKVNHPWTNGQVERINRTLKEATGQRYHYGSHEQLRMHLAAFLLAYNHAKRLKTLKGLTPHEFVCREWEREPGQFVRDPVHEPWDRTSSSKGESLRLQNRSGRLVPVQMECWISCPLH